MMNIFAWLHDEAWIIGLAYLVDIFDQQNKLNLQLQGNNTNIKFMLFLKGFMNRLE